MAILKPQTIKLGSAKYPPLLAEIHSPPRTLYVLGKLSLAEPTVAVVGSRKSTAYGQAITHRLAYDLASMGITIISGLALGIDSAAHRAALEAGGKTIAVLASGLDTIYPPSNRDLAEKILATGGSLISEHPLGTPPLRQYFPARNRIIAGLSQAVLVTEAPARSGALITANFALNENRLVLAAPANITSKSGLGNNNLLKAGAQPVTDVSDILEALNFEVADLKQKVNRPASREESRVLELLDQDISDSEDLIAQSGLDAIRFNQVITLMEISGKVRSLGAGKWTANG